MTICAKRAWLIAGALTGCLLAAVQILHDVRVPVRLVPGLAARVNGHEIDRASVDRTVSGFDSRLQMPESVIRDRVLMRMIDEDLLVQHALDSGVAETDPEVRAALVRAAINRLNSEVASASLSDAQIGAFYAVHRSAYASSATYQVIPLYYESPSFPAVEAAMRRADAAEADLRAGRPIAAIQSVADALPFDAPGTTLATARTLANYFGTRAAAELDNIRPGETTQPMPFGRGALLLYLNKRVDATSPPLQDIRDLVRADALREKQDGALADLLQSLRGSSRIDIAPASQTASVQ